MSVKHPGLLEDFLGTHTWRRVATSVHKRPGPVYYFIAVLAGGFFPWTALLAWALVRHFRRLRSDWSLWSLCIWGPAFVVFSLSGSKLPAYILPLLPIWSLLSARSVISPARTPGASPTPPGRPSPHVPAIPNVPSMMTAVLLFLAGVALLAILFLPVASEWGLPPVRGHLLLGAAALLLGGVAVAVLSRRGPRAWIPAAGGVWAVFFMCAASALPTIAPESGAVLNLGREAENLLTDRPDARLVAYRCRPGSLPFFTDRPITTVGEERETKFADPGLAARLVLPREAKLDSLMEEGPVLWVAKTRRKGELEERLGAPLITLVREGPWELCQVEERPVGF
jgi:4-amino-4-deoxy-L-arabinose transferase-like glycosyltransferase